ncbi:MAG: phage portal protein [Chloroflexi bacterium]|nr:phage portal protein [Chloroflexota bacterium]
MEPVLVDARGRALAPTASTRSNTSKPSCPEPWLISWANNGISNTTGETVNQTTALALSAYYACVRNIPEDLAKLTRKIGKKSGKTRTELPTHPLWKIFNQSPNPEMTAMSFVSTYFYHALQYKGAFAEIQRDIGGNVIALLPLQPNWVTMVRLIPETPIQEPPLAEVSTIAYRVRTGQSDRLLLENDVLHIQGLGLDGLLSFVITQIGAQSIGAALAVQTYRGSYFGNGANPSGILNVPESMRELSPEAHDRLVHTFDAKYGGGASNANSTILLEGGVKFEPLSVDPENSQMIEASEFNVEDIARWFRMPLSMIQQLENAHYNNIEHEARAYAEQTLMPWAMKLEQETKRKLFTPNETALYMKHDFRTMMRGDVATRIAAYKSFQDMGVMTINEIREREDLDGIGPEGDIRLISQQLQKLEDVGEEEPQQAAPVATPTSAPAEDTQEDDADRAMAVIRAYMPVIEVTVSKLITIEREKAGRAYARYDTASGAYETWCAKHLLKHETEVRSRLYDVLMPALNVIAAGAGLRVGDADTEHFVAMCVSQHMLATERRAGNLYHAGECQDVQSSALEEAEWITKELQSLTIGGA